MKHQSEWEQALDNAVSQLVAADHGPQQLPLYVSYKEAPIGALKNIRTALQWFWLHDEIQNIPLAVACLDRVLDRATNTK